ncbi:MAG: glycosyltransferase family 2 protein [Bacteroidales bacterium]|nr:glycosyltransferase family 2 protein [Bacteroidales bacterium]
MISVIICTYNRDKYIYNTLAHLANNTITKCDYEIVLINNNCTDNTESECLRFVNDYPDVRFHYFVERRQGLSYARNKGIEESEGDDIIFLDDDAFVECEYLENTKMWLSKYPDVAAWGGRITPLFEAGYPPKWWGSKWTVPWVSAIDLGSEARMFDKQYPIGANMGVRKSVVDSVGLFNTGLGRSKKNLMAGEEKDFFNRIKSMGGKIYYFPNINVQHVIPESRTTKNYIIRLGYGVGCSERLRCRSISGSMFVRRCMMEFVKWCGTLVLWFYYLITIRPIIGNYLILFRWHVSRGLVGVRELV